jgi:acetolactate decarboxylase
MTGTMPPSAWRIRPNDAMNSQSSEERRIAQQQPRLGIETRLLVSTPDISEVPMKKTVHLPLAAWCLVLVTALGHFVSSGLAADATVFQVSTFDALKKGQYDGHISFDQVKKHGNFGIGTVNGLDGEMVAVDGEFYQIRADGKVHTVPDSANTPFAVVAFFREDRTCTLQPIPNLAKVHEALDSLATCKDKLYAFRLDGVFKKLKVRSVPRQEKPYPPLESALQHQVIFDLTDVRGSMVGFRCPTYMDGVNLAGYHFHFISLDRRAGGHVLDCAAEDLTAHVMTLDGLSLKLLTGCEKASAEQKSP